MPSKILYVDDEQDIREIAQMSLELEPDFVVEICASGQDALVKAAEWQPDLVLIDVMMPRMDGPETLRRMRAASATAAIPVVFITARTQAHEVAEYKAIGAVDVMSKPFDPMTLARDVKALLGRARAQAPRSALAMAG